MLPLIQWQSIPESLMQVWYVEDASATGSLSSIKCWWDQLLNDGPLFGYHANPQKSWLVVEPEYREEAGRFFDNSRLNIMSEGRPFQGAAVGNHDFISQHVNS